MSDQTKDEIIRLMSQMPGEDVRRIIYLMGNTDLLNDISAKMQELPQEEVRPFMMTAIDEHQARAAQ